LAGYLYRYGSKGGGTMSTISAAWRQGRDTRRERRNPATLVMLVRLLAALTNLAARLPLAAIGAAGCLVAAGWHLGTVAGLIATAIALLFLEWRMTN
jgi:hypothetical protein